MKKKRKVKITDSMTGACVVIITDAPQDHIRQWVEDHKDRLEDGKNTGFECLTKDNYPGSLSKKFYVRVLHDSQKDPEGDINIIGWDEFYDIDNGGMQRGWDAGKQKLLDELEDVLKERRRKVTGRNSDSVIVENTDIGPDFQISITRAWE